MPQQQNETQPIQSSNEPNNQQNQKIQIDTIAQNDQSFINTQDGLTSDVSQQENSFVKLPPNQQNINNFVNNEDFEENLIDEKPVIQTQKPTLQQISQSANVISPSSIQASEIGSTQKNEVASVLSQQQANAIEGITVDQNLNESTDKNTTTQSGTISYPSINSLQVDPDLKQGFEQNNSESKVEKTYSQIPEQNTVIQNQAQGQTSNQPNLENNVTGNNQNQISVQNSTDQNKTGIDQAVTQLSNNQNQEAIYQSLTSQSQDGTLQNSDGSNQNLTLDYQNQVSTNQTGVNQPGANESAYQSLTNQPGVNQPGVNQPGTNQPGINQPGINQSESENLNSNNVQSYESLPFSRQNQLDTNNYGEPESSQADNLNPSRISQNSVMGNSSALASGTQNLSNDGLAEDRNLSTSAFESLPQSTDLQDGGLLQGQNIQGQENFTDQVNKNQNDQQANKILTDNNSVYGDGYSTSLKSDGKVESTSENFKISGQNTTEASNGEVNKVEYQRLQQASSDSNNNQDNSTSAEIKAANQSSLPSNLDSDPQKTNQTGYSTKTQDNKLNEINQNNYNVQPQINNEQSQNYRVSKLPGIDSGSANESLYETVENSSVSIEAQANFSGQNVQTLTSFEISQNNQDLNTESSTSNNKNNQQITELEESAKVKQNDVLSKLNDSFNKASKTEEIKDRVNKNTDLTNTDDNTKDSNSKFLDDQGNLKRVILESLPQQSFQEPIPDESLALNPRLTGFNVSGDNNYEEDDDYLQDSLPIRKRIKYITIGGNVIAALQSVDLPENSEAVINQKSLDDQIKQRINDESKPIEDQVYNSLLKEREALQSKLSDLENNKAYLRKAEENIQNQLVYLVANDQMVDGTDNSSSSPLNQIIQNFINEDKTTVENFKQETINQAIEMISGQKEIDEILLRQRIERELRYEFNQMQLDHEQKMKIIYRRMIESMYSELLNS